MDIGPNDIFDGVALAFYEIKGRSDGVFDRGFAEVSPFTENEARVVMNQRCDHFPTLSR